MIKSAIIIPARYNSSRFKGKPIKKILNKELVIWVADASAKAVGKKNVFVASDDKRIIKKVEKYDFNSIKTSQKCLTGTDRVAEAAKKINSKIYINVQGDEPLVKPSDIKKILFAKIKYPNYIICGYTKISLKEDPNNINIPKVVMNKKNELLYISRSVIPGSKIKTLKNTQYNKQVCIYAFSKKELLQYYNFKKKSTLEKIEDIEILRFLELGKKIKMIKTSPGSLAVDQKSDVKKVENYLKKKGFK